MNPVIENLAAVDRQLCWQDLKVGGTYRTIDRTMAQADLPRNAGGAPAGEFVAPDRVYRLVEDVIARTFVRTTGPATIECSQAVQCCVRVGDTLHAIIEVEAVQPDWRSGAALVVLNVEIRTGRGAAVASYSACRKVEGREQPGHSTAHRVKVPGGWPACQLIRTAEDRERSNGRMALVSLQP